MTIDTQNFDDWQDHPEHFWVQESKGIWRAGTPTDVDAGVTPHSRRIADEWGTATPQPRRTTNDPLRKSPHPSCHRAG